MWVYDGEDWTQDDGGTGPSNASKPEMGPQQWPIEMPELQVIEVEITQLPRNRQIPPFPM